MKVSRNKINRISIKSFALLGLLTMMLLWGMAMTSRAEAGDKSQAMYVAVRGVNLYTHTNTKSTMISIPYRTKVYLAGTERQEYDGNWFRVYYDRKILYLWQPVDKEYLTTYLAPSEYRAENSLQQRTMDVTKDIVENWDTIYAHGSSNGIPNENGVYGFDCSGFASYVINQSMQEFVPAYRLSTSIVTLYETDIIYNKGKKGEFKAKNVCTGKLDESKLQPGDVLFFNLFTEEDGTQHERGYNHCGIYIGNGEMVHSSHSFGGKVRVMPLSGIYLNNFTLARRYLPDSIDTIQTIGEFKYTLLTKTKVYSIRSTTSELVDFTGIEVPLEVLYEDNGSWAYVRLSNGKQGFVMKKNLSENFREENVVCYVRENGLNLYQGLTPTLGGIILNKGKTVILKGRVGAGNYYEVEYQGQTYYVHSEDGIESKLSTGVISEE